MAPRALFHKHVIITASALCSRRAADDIITNTPLDLRLSPLINVDFRSLTRRYVIIFIIMSPRHSMPNFI